MHKGLIGLGIVGIGATVFLAANLHSRLGPTNLYPDPVKTPGEINLDIRSEEQIASTICNPKWTTKNIRPPSNYTKALKLKQLQSGYNVGGNVDPKNYEEDHLISLELGGSPTSTKNLWPEAYNTYVGNQIVGAHEKDKVENWLHSRVCIGMETLREAQSLIVNDWYAVYKQIEGESLGASDSDTQ